MRFLPPDHRQEQRAGRLIWIFQDKEICPAARAAGALYADRIRIPRDHRPGDIQRALIMRAEIGDRILLSVDGHVDRIQAGGAIP